MVSVGSPAMTKLNQLLAVEKGLRARTNAAFTSTYRDVLKVGLLSGISRTYTPRDDEGETFPAESTLVQMQVGDALGKVEALLGNLWDVVVSREATNAHAAADVVLHGEVVAAAVPVTALLFLEKQLVELAQFVRELPTLDPAEEWTWDEAQGVYRTHPVMTNRSKKIPRNHVKAEATDKHPAQVEIWFEDVVVGQWATVKFSGAIPATVRDLYVERVAALADAVKYAREAANEAEVEQTVVGRKLLGWVFRGTLPVD